VLGHYDPVITRPTLDQVVRSLPILYSQTSLPLIPSTSAKALAKLFVAIEVYFRTVLITTGVWFLVQVPLLVHS